MKFRCRLLGQVAPGLLTLALGLGISKSALGQAHYAYAQSPKAQAPAAQGKPSSTVTEWRDAQGRSPATQMTETQTVADGKQVKAASWQTPSTARAYQPGADSEEETQQVDAKTVRVVQRLYATDANGNRKVIGVTEEERRTLPDGKETITRTASRPDLNGGFQVVRQDVEETSTAASGVKESRTTVLTPGLEQRLVPHEQILKTERKQGDLETAHTTHLLPDGNGSWQVNKVEDNVVKARSKDTRTIEERVYQRDAQQNLSVSKEVITNTWKDASGQEHELLETHSTSTPGATVSGDGRLVLDRRLHVVRHTAPNGSQTVEEQQEVRDQNAPFNGMRVAQRVLQTSTKGGGGTTKQGTVEADDGNGGTRVIWVFTTRPAAQ